MSPLVADDHVLHQVRHVAPGEGGRRPSKIRVPHPSCSTANTTAPTTRGIKASYGIHF